VEVDLISKPGTPKLPNILQCRKQLTLQLFILMFPILLTGQTWTGAVDSSWNNPANWNTNAVPTLSTEVFIPDVDLYPVVDAPAKAMTVHVQAGGDLKIRDSLIIKGEAFGFSLKNEGFIYNYGHILIGTSTETSHNGIENLGMFQNKVGGTIHINKTAVQGILNNTGASFVNEDSIVIGSVSSPGAQGIYNVGGSTFQNVSGGHISVNRSSNNGILNLATFNNQGELYIGGIASNGSDGIESNGLFTNDEGGDIKIFRSNDIGINLAGGTFDNADSITMGEDFGLGRYGIYVDAATFNNNAGGMIRINRASQIGFAVFSGAGTFNNFNHLTIGDVNLSAGTALSNLGEVNNKPDGVINLDRGYIQNNSTISNEGTINIGAVASVGGNGIYNSSGAVFTNKVDAIVNVDRSTSRAIQGQGTSTFDNFGLINIGVDDLSGDGINLNNFSNEVTGVVNINRAGTGIGGTFSNDGTVTIGEISAVTTLVNSAGFQNNTGGVLNGTGTIGTSNMNNNGGTIAPGYDSPGIISYSVSDIVNLTNSVLKIDVDGIGTEGIDYDKINKGIGSITLGGSLDLNVGYTPAVGDSVTIIKAFNIFGTFSSFTGMTEGWTIHYNSPEQGKVTLVYGHLWTGAIDSDWHTAGNWVPMEVPDSTSVVSIPDVANDPIISAFAEVNTLAAEPGAMLTLTAADTLRINGSSEVGLLNQGEVLIQGILNIGDTREVGDFGIRNESLFNLETGGVINIDQCVAGGIDNVAGGTINNNSNMFLGSTDAVGLTGILNEGAFNHLSGQISIDQCTAQGIQNVDGGVFINSATLNIGSTLPIGSYAVLNEGQFDNNTDATINLDNFSIGGFLHSLGHFSNQGIISSPAPNAGQFIFESSSLTDMDDGGEIRIN